MPTADIEIYTPDESYYGQKTEAIISFENYCNHSNLVADYMQSGIIRFSLKPGHLLAFQKLASQLKARKGFFYNEWVNKMGSAAQLTVVHSKGSILKRVLSEKLDDDNIDMKFVTIKGVEHPFIQCSNCKKWFKPYCRKAKNGEINNYETDNYMKHVVKCKGKSQENKKLKDTALNETALKDSTTLTTLEKET